MATALWGNTMTRRMHDKSLSVLADHPERTAGQKSKKIRVTTPKNRRFREKSVSWQDQISGFMRSKRWDDRPKQPRWPDQTTEFIGTNNWDDRHNTLFWQGDKGADKHNCLCVNCLRKVPLNSWKSGRQTTCSERTLSQSSFFVRKGNKQINIYLTFQSSSPLWSEVQGRRQWGL